METSLKKKITVKADYNNGNSSSFPSDLPLSRPTSPSKIPINSSLSLLAKRPTAKVNSSAVTIRKPSSASSLSISRKTTGSQAASSRAASPYKPPGSSNRGSSAGMTTITRVTARPSSKSDTIQSRTTRANIYQRSLAVASPDVTFHHSLGRPRSTSATWHHASSTSSLTASSPPFSLSSPMGSDGSSEKLLAHTDTGSSIAELAQYNYLDSAPVLSVSPVGATGRPIHPRVCVPSEPLSCIPLLSSPSPALYTSDAVSYPYGRGTIGRAPSPGTGGIHHTSASNDHSIDERRVDAIAIPVFPHSPPVSALSLSSPSAVSRSAISNTTDNSGESSISTSAMNSPLKKGGDSDMRGLSNQRSCLGDLSVGDEISSRDSTLVTHGRLDYRDDVELSPQSPEHKVKAEAKSNRKIEDLEITNRSLLAINASLEKTKHRQAKEIRDLRRKLRDSRLCLSPETFRILSSLPCPNESDHDEEDEESENREQGKSDVMYERIKVMLEGLIESGKKALELSTVGGERGATRVLNAEEICP